MGRKLHRFFLFSLFFVIGFAAGVSVADEPKADAPIKIGLVLPLTGDLAAVGSACRDAARFALDEARATAQRRYELVFEDDHLMAADAAKAAHRLLDSERVSAIVSTWSYGGRVIAPLAERARIPHVGVAWDAKVAEGDFNFLHLTPPSEFMKKFLEVFRKLKVTRVALLGIEESGSVFALDEFQRLEKDYGVTVVFREAVPSDSADISSLVTRLIHSKPEYLLGNSSQAMTLKVLQALERLKAPFKYTAITSFDVLEDPRVIEGRWYVSDSLLPEDFAGRFEQAYHHKLRYGVGNFYEAVRLLIKAFETAPSRTPEAARDTLAKTEESASIFGSTSVDRHGIFSYPARYVKVINGERKLVTLDEINE